MNNFEELKNIKHIKQKHIDDLIEITKILQNKLKAQVIEIKIKQEEHYVRQRFLSVIHTDKEPLLRVEYIINKKLLVDVY